MSDLSFPETAAWPALGTAGKNTYRVSEDLVDMRRPVRAVRAARVRAEPQEVVIDLNRTALVIVDMQNDFCDANGWLAGLGVAVGPMSAISGPINAVTAALRSHAVPVIWLNWGVRADRLNLSPATQHAFNHDGRAPGLAGEVVGAERRHRLLEKDSWGAQIIDALDQSPDDIHVDKHRISGFLDTPLDSILRNLDVSTLLFAGVNADHCVLGTLMDANFKGYDTILLQDCTATSSPDFCMQATLHNVRFCFGFTATSEDLTAGLAAA